MKKRNLHLDIVRILACIMVILMHSPIPSSNNANGLLLSSLSYFTAPCIGLFFMVSGALLLPPPYHYNVWKRTCADFLAKEAQASVKAYFSVDFILFGCEVGGW